MKKMMLIGRSGAGKTTFCQALNDLKLEYKKTQAIEFLDNAIDTPGEYMERQSLYRALIVTAIEADLIVMVQSCTDEVCVFPPGLSGMFGKPAVGIISKTDLAEKPEMIEEAEQKLRLAGCDRIYPISSLRKDGLSEIRRFLEEEV